MNTIQCRNRLIKNIRDFWRRRCFFILIPPSRCLTRPRERKKQRISKIERELPGYKNETISVGVEKQKPKRIYRKKKKRKTKKKS